MKTCSLDANGFLSGNTFKAAFQDFVKADINGHFAPRSIKPNRDRFDVSGEENFVIPAADDVGQAERQLHVVHRRLRTAGDHIGQFANRVDDFRVHVVVLGKQHLTGTLQSDVCAKTDHNASADPTGEPDNGGHFVRRCGRILQRQRLSRDLNAEHRVEDVRRRFDEVVNEGDIHLTQLRLVRELIQFHGNRSSCRTEVTIARRFRARPAGTAFPLGQSLDTGNSLPPGRHFSRRAFASGRSEAKRKSSRDTLRWLKFELLEWIDWMWPDSEQTAELLQNARQGESSAVNELMERHRNAVRQMIQMRLDRAVAARVDASDVVQDVLLEASQRLNDFIESGSMPFHLWLRQLAKDRLIDMHRRHRGAQRRSVDREQRVAAGSSERSSLNLDGVLADGQLTPAAASIRREIEQRFLTALQELGDDDRDIILMRHQEHLTNSEVAEALGLSQPAAGMRYLRALRKLREVLGETSSS